MAQKAESTRVLIRDCGTEISLLYDVGRVYLSVPVLHWRHRDNGLDLTRSLPGLGMSDRKQLLCLG